MYYKAFPNTNRDRCQQNLQQPSRNNIILKIVNSIVMRLKLHMNYKQINEEHPNQEHDEYGAGHFWD